MKSQNIYIILGSVFGIGGWQLYVDARYKYLSDKGFYVYVLYPTKEKQCIIKLQNLQTNNCLEFYPLRFPPYVLTKNQIKNAINYIKDRINYHDKDNVFVESTCISYSLWGELIAQQTNGVNFAYLLHSHIDNPSLQIQKFFEFKYRQNLLGGQSDITLPDLFNGYIKLDSNDLRSIPASWGPTICDNRSDCQEYINNIIHYKNKGYKIIGYFGTLQKPHVPKICKEIINYSKLHINSNFLFITIGSSILGNIEQDLSSLVKDVNNLKLINIPEMYPVPKRIFEFMDTCLASWGCSNAAAYANQRVIRLMDDVEVIPQGIIGITLRKMPYYKLYPGKETLFELLDIILFGNNYIGIDYCHPPHKDMNIEKQNFIDSKMKPFMKRNNICYYDITKMKPERSFDRKYWLLHRVLGFHITKILRKIKLIMMN